MIIALSLFIFIIGMWIGATLESPHVCPHSKKCKLYQEDSATCNYNEGFYGDRLATCRVNFEENRQ